MKYFLYIAAASCLLSACNDDFFSQTVEIDPPAYNKQLSFHLDLDNQDSIVELTLTRNYGVLEDVENYTDWFIANASIELYENGQKWLTLAPDPASPFHYVSALPHKFQTGSTYEIRAEHPDFPKATAIQVVPKDFQLDSAHIQYNAVPDEYGDLIDLLEVFLKDEGGVKNYYEIKATGWVYDIVYLGNGEMDTIGIRERELNVDGYNDPNVQEGYNGGALISDQFFDGQAYKFQARVYAANYNFIDSTIIVSVRNVTEDYYKWSRSYERKVQSDENPLVEPISVFNNLQNGLGIFSVSNEKAYLIKQ